MFTKHIHYSLELETEIIGACLLEAPAFSRVYGFLETETFYNGGHKQVFEVMKEMFTHNMPVTLLSVFDYMVRRKNITEINGNNTAYYLTKLTEKVTSTANIEYYSLILKQMWIDREIIILTNSGIKSNNTRQEIMNLQNKLTELSSINFTSDWKEMDELMVGLLAHQSKMEENKGTGLITGFRTIDQIYGGFFPGQMVVVGARPSVGKSAFAGQMAMNMAVKGNRVGFISLEMSNNQIAARFAALDTQIEFGEIWRSLYEDENQRERFYSRVNKYTSTLPISVSDKTDVNIAEIKAKAYKLKYKHGKLDCLILDYLQLVEGDLSNRNRENEVSKISRGCKVLAKELEVPFIVLCQLNREAEKRTGKQRFPKLMDLRESGAIEQDADVVMFLHSDYKSGLTEDENGNTTEGKANLIIAKWRDGVPYMNIDLDFDGPTMKFSESGSNWRPVKHFSEPQKEEDEPF